MKKVLSALMVLAILVASLSCFTVSAAAASKWDGYVKITNASQLKKMEGSSSKFYLANDIDLSDDMWTPISSFSGTLDGNGHCIKNLTSTQGGLFGRLSGGTVIKNLGITDVKINNNGCAVFANYSGGALTISNCFASGEISSPDDGASGFIRTLNISKGTSLFTDCINLVNINTTNTGALAADASGFVGEINIDNYACVTFERCVNAGIINSSIGKSSAICSNATRNDSCSPKLVSCYNVSAESKDLPLVRTAGDSLMMQNCATVTSIDISKPSANCIAQADVDVAASKFKKKSTYKDFDFTNTWKIGADGYAVLKIMDTEEAEEPVEFSYFTITLKKGEKIKLGAVLSPSNAKVTWKSSRSSVASVSSKGTVTAKKKGSAIITVKSGDVSMKIKIVVTNS